MSVKDDLIAARALIDTPEKWIKGTYASKTWRYCALGAASECSSSTDAYAMTRAALLRALPPPCDCVATFNDHPDTTHADVIALFDRAIAAEEAREAA